MDPRIQIWQVLHDGEITVVRMVDGALIVFVNIPYVRERIAPLGDSVVLRLVGLRSFTLLDSTGSVLSTDAMALSMEGYEILSTESTAMPVSVELNMGSMQLEFDRLEVALDTGQAIDLPELAAAFDGYWREFEARTAELKNEKN